MAAGLLALLPSERLGAQSHRSLTDSEERILLVQGATIVAPEDAGGSSSDVQMLQENIFLLRASIRSLTESLAIANNEAETFKRQSADLALKLEALGIAGVEKDSSKLEQRLLAAVRDLRLLQNRHQATTDQLVELTETIQMVMKTSEGIPPEARMKVETELRKTSETLGTSNAVQPGAISPTLHDGMVMDVKEELSLVIANIGKKEGVQVGMPFQVWHGNRHIGDVRVVDVREHICGAVIQNLKSEKKPIKTGDRLKVDAQL
jgi:predicted transcriptional regulator